VIGLQTGRDLLEEFDPAKTDQIVSMVLTTVQHFLFGEEEDTQQILFTELTPPAAQHRLQPTASHARRI
jgi:hypothetical protein